MMLSRVVPIVLAMILGTSVGSLQAAEIALLDAETAWRANLTLAPALVRTEGKLQLQVKTWPVEMKDFDPGKPGDWLGQDVPAENPAGVLNSAVPIQTLRQFLLPPAPGWQNVEFDDSLWASHDADLFKIGRAHV